MLKQNIALKGNMFSYFKNKSKDNLKTLVKNIRKTFKKQK